MMYGAMQRWPLLVSRLIEFAASAHPGREIVSVTHGGSVHRTNWAEIYARARRVAAMLERLRVQSGDRVGTLAWNTHRHLECLYGIAGIGAVAHTINPRLFAEQIVYIVNHARDRVLLLDADLLPLVEGISDRLPSVETFIVLAEKADIPESALPLRCYEDLLRSEDADYRWPDLDEEQACGLCYTSGTTGDPKGVLYSHRSQVLHSWGSALPDALNLSSHSVVLAMVPMFHANGWGLPYSAAMTGAKLVLPGSATDGATIRRLIEEEGVTVTAGVPTVWLGLLADLEADPGDRPLGSLERIGIGGSAASRAMIEELERKHGVTVTQVWGATELSPIGTVCTLCPDGALASPDDQLALKVKQGRRLFGVDLEIADEAGVPVAHDGKSSGNLKIRGPWAIDHYYGREPRSALDGDGWFSIGDLATIDPLGYLQITDRTKDVIKSGGEWISSVDLENAATGCPGVKEAAVIAIPHPRWMERPLLVIVRKPGQHPTPTDIRAHLERHVAKWWLPDDIEYLEELPHTATGKIQKTALREMFSDYVPQSA